VILTPDGEYTFAQSDGSNSTLPVGERLMLKAEGGDVVLLYPGTDNELARISRLVLRPQDDGTIQLEGVPFGVGWWWESKENRIYEGVMEASAKEDGTLDVIMQLPVEEYLRGVVPSEIGGTSPAEALKAQAVAARSETMTALGEGTYAGPNYDICADVDCQVFAGTKKRTAATDEAIRATRGIILTYDGKPIPAYYASNSGGFTEDVRNVWPHRDRGIPCYSPRYDGEGDGPSDLNTEEGVRTWIAARPRVFSNADFHENLPDWTKKNFRWEVTTSADDLTTMVAQRKDIGRVTAIEPLERGPSGRLIKVRFVGETGSLEVGPELSIRQVWQPPLKSSAFVVDAEEGKFRIRGAGYGHGVGMCQTGAISRALSGQDYKTILLHYYTQAELVSAYE